MKKTLERSYANEWQVGINIELLSLHKNNIWKFTPLPSNRNPINLKWGFKIKINVDRTIDKYKARLVARHFSQVQGVDYIETFLPMVKLNSIKVLIVVTTQHNL